LSTFPVEEYVVDVFKELGFHRYLCPSCGSHFWSLDGGSKVCGEAPCVEYSFIGNPIGRQVSEVSEVRDSFLRFFENRGHMVLEPYPVVSRWRNDLYLTDASIVDFQPYVTNGIIPPPANPLVISQPCIRLVDIDNVGSSLGRYFTIFEMGGHHAFNYPDREVYWKDRTVRYCIEYFTEALEFPLESLSFKESVWSGGGNAGPCFEVISGGIEVATLVFMKFKTTPSGELLELPIRTVDTGYGIDSRILWVLTGEPTPFSVLYKPVFKWITSLVGFSYDDVIKSYAQKIALFNPRKERAEDFRARVLSELGVSIEGHSHKIEVLENVIRALDHSKSLVFVLSEGVVPSNVGVGYLARLLARKTMRALRLLGQHDKFIELIERQLKLWGPEFRNIRDNEDEVLLLANIEANKYEETLEKGKRVVERLLSSGGSSAFDENAFVMLYDSHGLTPDDVVAFARSSKGVTLKPPEEFFSRMAARHAKELISKAEATVPQEIPGLSELQPTEKLYYDSASLLSCRSKVLRFIEPNLLILDSTVFYPEGGGQPSDRGYIEFDGQRFEVKEVGIYGNIILHKLDRRFTGAAGVEVKCVVDESRRWALRRAHTATHIVNWAARQVLGRHIWQHGAQKGEIESRLDITHYANLSDDEIARIETLANELVVRDVPVKVEFLDRTTAERKYGFRIYQGGVVPSKEIRIVSVGDYEVEACGGLHLDSTGQAGVIKITGVDKIQDGVVRLTFKVGLPAVEHIREIETTLRRASEVAKSDWRLLPSKLSEILKEMEEITSALEAYREADARSLSAKFLEDLQEIKNLKYLVYVDARRDLMSLIKAGQELLEKEPKAILVLFSTAGEKTEYAVMAGKQAVDAGFNSGLFVKTLASSIHGGGGGKPNFGRGGVKKSYSAKELIEISGRLLDTTLRA
jgi:alanyl-tRNA synthetase